MKLNEDIVVTTKNTEEDGRNILARNIDQIITEQDFWKAFRSGRQLRIKHGVDPTNPFLHLGHAVNYWKMREFQELGHKVVFLIGDFTARIGDPTGRSSSRPELSQKDIEENAKEYLSQAAKILISKPSLLEIRKNSEWYGKMKLADFLGLAKKITHSRLIGRDMFQGRIKKREEIYIHEMLYPILQGYDSVMVKSDLTIIGSDQLFNELVGRHYQALFGQDPQVIMTTLITPGLDGKEKMSKSLENYIAITDTSKDKFGKIMTLPDGLVRPYFVVYTKVPAEEISGIEKQNSFEAKKKLAFEIVKLYHGDKEARKAQTYFEKTFSKKEIPKDIQQVKILPREDWAAFLTRNKFVKSRSEAKRLIIGGGVDLAGARISDPAKQTEEGVAKIGKFKFVRLVK